nr:uncharacterized protein LOC111754579 [Cavia porcellus]
MSPQPDVTTHLRPAELLALHRPQIARVQHQLPVLHLEKPVSKVALASPYRTCCQRSAHPLPPPGLGSRHTALLSPSWAEVPGGRRCLDLFLPPIWSLTCEVLDRTQRLRKQRKCPDCPPHSEERGLGGLPGRPGQLGPAQSSERVGKAHCLVVSSSAEQRGLSGRTRRSSAVLSVPRGRRIPRVPTAAGPVLSRSREKHHLVENSETVSPHTGGLPSFML